MRAGRLRDTGRSFCCTRKYRKGRKRKKSERKSGNLLNTDLGTLGARYLLHLVDEWNSGRKLSFAYTFSAIVMVSGDDAGSHGVFFIQGYGTGRDRIININTVNIGVNLECRLTAEMDVYIRNATVPVGISAFMLLGKLPIVSK